MLGFWSTMHSLLFLSLFSSLALSQQASTKWTPGQKVKTTSGMAMGQDSQWQPGVSEYLGIPFAQPPVGNLRFAPPKRFSGSSVLNATRFSPDCPANLRNVTESRTSANSSASEGFQTFLGLLGQVSSTRGEDCLTLNVWTKPQSGESNKAVMVWIYGGGFSTGNSASPSYNGAKLAAEEDVIVVSMNYRLNIFGFPGAPFLEDNNLGLLDQRSAVEWVRDNIKAFGGDPSRITLFGESAGGASVDYYSYAYTADPIVAGFIPESGTVGISVGASPNATGDGWYSASEKLGCGGRSAGKATLACVQSKDWQSVLKAIDGAASISQAGANFFGPFRDNKIVFGDYAARQKAGKLIKAPMLVGSNNNEGGLFNILAGKPGDADAALYNAVFTCPSEVAATSRRDLQIPAWRYRYFGEFPNQFIGANAGAYHSAEIGLVFGTTVLASGKPDTPEQAKLSKAMRVAWTSFAKDPANGLSKLGWPLYDENKPTLIKLGGVNTGEIQFVDPKQYDATCAMMPKSST